MYKTPKQLDLAAIDKEILDYWKDNDIFQKSIDQRDPENAWVFYDGPPSANGKPGIHHVISRTIKDMFCRFHSMKGKYVNRKAGWDTHGLPIELAVEKELGITKEDIGTKISVDDYNNQCRATVMQYKDMWDDLTTKMGYWVDIDNPYITFDNNYIESVWWLLGQLYKKGYMYKGYTVQPFSPAAGTGLSTHELNQPGCYKDVTDTTAVAQFKVKNNATSQALFDLVSGDAYILAWTTTPWTLPSNTFLAVGKKIEYLVVKTYNPYTKLPVNVVLAKELMGKWFKPNQAEADYDAYTPESKVIPYVVLGSLTGAELAGMEYDQLMPYAQPEDGDCFKVLTADFVSTSDGTGIVHCAPSFGTDDMMTGKANGMGSLTLVDRQGRFVDSVTDFAGRFVKDYRDEEDYVSVDVDIVIKLKKENLCFNAQRYVHSYPHCWRTDKPVLYYPLDSWFVKTTAAKERMIELNNTINWKPAHTGEKRFGNWLENLQDWNLSRSRYWGIPLPIWRTEDGEQEICISSIEELTQEMKKADAALGMTQEVPKDMHRPYIDEVILVSPDGQKMVRELDLIDVWFDSGSMPYAQWHYPFENKEEFEKNFPADFIAEGVDQTRGWFFTLHAIATMVFDSVAYKNVMSNGLVQDKDGRKMSKRLNNAVEPFSTLTKYGADASRLYMISNAQPWDNLKFDLNGLDEVRRKFFGTLYNTYSFFALYANIDKFEYKEADIALEDKNELDRWILSLLNTLVKDVDAYYADFEPTQATRRIMEFLDENLSNWYVRQSRRRFWKGEYSTDKISAYQTLYTCMTTLSQLIAPVAPFFSDWLYQKLNDATGKNPASSVHLCDFPVADETLIDKDLEQRMSYAQKISSLVLSLRAKNKLRVRQPLQKILLPVVDSSFEERIGKVKDLILSETNIKEIEFIVDTVGYVKKSIKANFKTLGRKMGKDMKIAAGLIAQYNDTDINEIEKNGGVSISANGTEYALEMEDFVITYDDIPGWQVASDGPLTVALDVTITDDLIAEGMARELINRIQNHRKDSGFEVMDNIKVTLDPNDLITAAVANYNHFISKEVLAVELTVGDASAGVDIDIDGTVIKMLVEKV